jgi:hypothetical protein
LRGDRVLVCCSDMELIDSAEWEGGDKAPFVHGCKRLHTAFEPNKLVTRRSRYFCLESLFDQRFLTAVIVVGALGIEGRP